MKYFIVLISVLFITLSCNKPSDPTPDKKNMLRTGKWKLTDMAYTYLIFKPGQPGYDTTVHDTLQDCNLDDYWVFGPGFNGTINAGTKHCATSDPDQVPFRWETLNTDTTLVLYGMGTYGASLTDTSLNYIAAIPGTVHGSGPVFTDPYKAVFKSFSQSNMVLRISKTYVDPVDNKKVDTSFWDYTFVNF